MSIIYNKRYNKGKRVVLFIIGTIYLYILLRVIVDIEQIYNKDKMLSLVLILVVSSIPSYLFYKGVKFAKWIILAFFVNSFLEIILYFVDLIGISNFLEGWFTFGLVNVLVIFGGLFLVSNEDIDEFTRVQRENRRWLNKN